MELIAANTLEIPKPSLWPISMARFGNISDGAMRGQPMFRVSFAPTVKKLVFGFFSALNYTGCRLRPAYREIGQKWILEKWKSGFELTQMSPAEYERWGPRDPQSGMLIEGPYPYDGRYEFCWEFDEDTLRGGMEGAVEKIIGLINQGAKRTASEIKANNRELDAKAEKQAAEQRFLRCREVEPLYGARAANFAGRPKTVNHKTQRMPIAANELGLPVKRGSVMAMRGPKVNASI